MGLLLDVLYAISALFLRFPRLASDLGTFCPPSEAGKLFLESLGMWRMGRLVLRRCDTMECVVYERARMWRRLGGGGAFLARGRA